MQPQVTLPALAKSRPMGAKGAVQGLRTRSNVLPLAHGHRQPIQAHIVVVVHLNNIPCIILLYNQLPERQCLEGQRLVVVLQRASS